MTCKTVQSLLSPFIDQELRGHETLLVRDHLAVCPECSEELRCIEQMKLLLGSPVPEPSADFENRLVARVLSAPLVTPAQKRVSWLALGGFAAASMLATMLILNALPRNVPAATTEHSDEAVYRMVEQDRAFSASADPLSGSSVFPVSFRGR